MTKVIQSTIHNSCFIVPLPNLSFSLVGFTSFHSIYFYIVRHCGTFIVYNHEFLFRLKNSRQSKTALGYFFPKHKHYYHLRIVRAWTFLYISLCSVYPDYSFSFPKIIFSSCDTLLSKSTLVISFSPYLIASILDLKFLISCFND